MNSMTKTYNGLNGTIILNASDSPGVTVGYVPGESYGYKRKLRVTVDIRIERLESRDQYETTSHELVSAPLDFALTSNVWRPGGGDIISGGATVEPLREVLASGDFGPGMDAAKVSRLIELHEQYHLSGMQAGCEHQTVVWEDSQYGRRPSLELTEPCPVTGYRYGSAWLLKPLPEGIVGEVRELLADAIADRRVYVHPDYVTA